MTKDESKAVAGSRSMIFWCILLVLSILLIVDSGSLEAILAWSACASSVGFVGLLFRLRKFLKNSDELLRTGESTRPYDHGKHFRTLILFLFLTPLAFFAPLFFAAQLSFGLLLGSLLGVIDGWVLGLLLYNFYLISWQKKNKGNLFIFQKWSGREVTHLGLSFVRSSDNE